MAFFLPMKIELIHLIETLVCVQSYLFALFLLTHSKGKKISNLVLGIFLLFLGSQMLSVVLASTGIVPVLDQFNGSYGYVYGALFYLYTCSLIYKNFRFKPSYWWHFVPFMVITMLPFFGIDIRHSSIVGLYLSILSYLILSIREITHYHLVIKNTTSNYEKINLSWLRLAISIFSTTLTIDIIQYLANKYKAPFWFSVAVSYTVFLGLLTFVVAMVYKGLKHPSLFMGISEEDNTQRENQAKYANETLASQDNQANLRKLQAYMDTHQPHLQPELTLNMLANALDLPSRYLSQIINYHLGQNFSDFINTYRIEAAKHRLQNPKDDKETILEVLYEVGFNSKSSFNAIFKKKTGLTPTEFKQQC